MQAALDTISHVAGNIAEREHNPFREAGGAGCIIYDCSLVGSHLRIFHILLGETVAVAAAELARKIADKLGHGLFSLLRLGACNVGVISAGHDMFGQHLTRFRATKPPSVAASVRIPVSPRCSVSRKAAWHRNG